MTICDRCGKRPAVHYTFCGTCRDETADLYTATVRAMPEWRAGEEGERDGND